MLWYSNQEKKRFSVSLYTECWKMDMERYEYISDYLG